MRGRIGRGDALMLYTDGLVETPQRDIALGIDQLLGQAERLLRGGFEEGASRLIDRLESRTTTGRCCCCTGAEREPSGCWSG